MTPVLEVENLRVDFSGRTAAVRGVSLKVQRGETHCLVGESGCGKSVSSLAVMGLLARGAVRRADVLRFQDTDLTRLNERGMARLRGARMAHQVSVMYAGEVVETATAEKLFAAPTHPYTRGLLACIPIPGTVRRDEPLGSIPGTVPRITPGFTGCGFRDRCAQAQPACAQPVALRNAAPGHAYRCILPVDWT